jgi:hypothetical protein
VPDQQQPVQVSQPMEVSSRRTEEPSLPGLIAIACTLMNLAAVTLFLVVGGLVLWMQPDLDEFPLILPLTGAIVISGTCVAVRGLIAGIVDLMRARIRRGLSVLAVFVNGAVCVAVFLMIVTALVR